MKLVRTILWVMLLVVLAIFMTANWVLVTVTILPGMEMDTKVPLLMLIAFLVGLLPVWIAHRASRWSLRRRLDYAERQLAMAREQAQIAPVVTLDPASETEKLT